MAQSNINIRMDEDLKRQFEAFCSDMGMTMSTAVIIFVKKTLREYRIPFEIGAETPNKETIEAMLEAERIARDPSVKGYSTMEELKAALEK